MRSTNAKSELYYRTPKEGDALETQERAFYFITGEVLMKWLLIAAALQMNVVYQDEKTCEIAAEKLNEITDAVCIPLGEDQKEEKFATKMDIFFDKFLDIVEKIKKFEEKHEDPKQDAESDQKQVDNSVKSVYNT